MLEKRRLMAALGCWGNAGVLKVRGSKRLAAALLGSLALVAAACSAPSASASTHHGTSVAASHRPADKGIDSYASLKQVLHAVSSSVHMVRPPNDVVPSLSALAAGRDYGGDILNKSKCHHIATNSSNLDVAGCAFGDKSSSTVVALIGDSRAAMWLYTFNELGRLEHFKVEFLSKEGCPTALLTFATNNDGAVSSAPWPACSAFHYKLLNALAKLKPAVTVISTNVQLDLADPPGRASPAEVKRGLEAFMKRLPKSSKNVMLGAFPQPAPSEPTICLSKGPSAIDRCDFKVDKANKADIRASQQAARLAKVAFIDQTPWFCASACPPIVGHIIVYTTDSYHADETYLNYLTRVLWGALQPYIRPS